MRNISLIRYFLYKGVLTLSKVLKFVSDEYLPIVPMFILINYPILHIGYLLVLFRPWETVPASLIKIFPVNPSVLLQTSHCIRRLNGPVDISRISGRCTECQKKCDGNLSWKTVKKMTEIVGSTVQINGFDHLQPIYGRVT